MTSLPSGTVTRGIAFNIPTHNEGGALNLSTMKRGEQEIILKIFKRLLRRLPRWTYLTKHGQQGTAGISCL
jgi:hypothetical protein